MPRRTQTSPKAVELERSRTPFVVGGAVLVGLLLTGGAIMWGTSDAGQINVSATIANSQQTDSERNDAPVTIATEEHRALPNGGLVAQDGNTPLSPPPPVTESASSTDSADTESAEGEETFETQAEQSESGTSEEGGGDAGSAQI